MKKEIWGKNRNFYYSEASTLMNKYEDRIKFMKGEYPNLNYDEVEFLINKNKEIIKNNPRGLQIIANAIFVIEEFFGGYGYDFFISLHEELESNQEGWITIANAESYCMTGFNFVINFSTSSNWKDILHEYIHAINYMMIKEEEDKYEDFCPTFPELIGKVTDKILGAIDIDDNISIISALAKKDPYLSKNLEEYILEKTDSSKLELVAILGTKKKFRKKIINYMLNALGL